MKTPPQAEFVRLAEAADGGPPLVSATMKSRVAHRLFGDGKYPMLGRFVVSGVLGSGGTGIVYSALDPHLDRRVALKVLDPERVAAGPERLRLVSEARALARLAHPNVVVIHEVGEAEGSVFLVMEQIEGLPLHEWLRARPRSLAEILTVYHQAGEGLAAAHAAGLAHRDFKPPNVLVGRDPNGGQIGRVRVVDFGLAAAPDAMMPSPGNDGSLSGDVTRSTLAGTPAYMAPEQAALRTADALSDQFSFCVSLWEAIEGQRPWKSTELAHLAKAEPRTMRQLPSTRNSPRWLTKCLARGLAPNPTDRYPGMEHLLGDLRAGPIARRRRHFALAVVAGAAATGSVFAGTRPPSCPQSSEELAGVWDPERRARLGEAVAGVAEFAAASYPSTAARLDAYAAEWSATMGEICEATFDRGTWSADSFERGLACLRRRRDALASVADLLEGADAEVLARADGIVDAMPESSPCGDVAALERAPQAASEGVIREADRARLLAAAGRSDEARDAASKALDLAQASEADLAGESEARLVRAIVLTAAEDSFAAADEFTAAIAAAQRAASDDTSARAWLGLAAVRVRGLQDLEGAAFALALAEATIDRLGGHPLLRADALDIQASIASKRGDRVRATELRSEAIDLLSASAGNDEPQTLTVKRRLANDLAALQRYEDAQASYVALRDRVVARLGERHPDVGSIELDLGLLARDRGQVEEAERHFELAFDILRDAFGSGSPRLARILTALALNDFERGELVAAADEAQRAWELQRIHLAKGHTERAGGLSLLAAIHVREGKFDAAVADHRLILNELDPAKDAERITVAHNTLGWLLCHLDRCSEATPHYRLILDASPPWPLYGENGLARVELAAGENKAAIRRLEQALPAASALPGAEHGELIAEMHWTLAHALAAQGERQRATEHAAAARRYFDELGVQPDAVAALDRLAKRLR